MAVRIATVLVVDDEESVRVTLAAILSSHGYEVELAATGMEALTLLQVNEFDLVLTDLRMEGVDGLQVLGEAKRRWPDSVTIMLTGYASMDSAIAAMRQGAYDYLCKPCPTEELLATVARGLERRRLTRDLKLYVRQLEISIDTARELYSVMDARLLEAKATLQDREQELAALYGDLRTPLVTISSLAQLVLGSLNQPNATQPVDGTMTVASSVTQIQSEADRLTQHVNSLLQRPPSIPAEEHYALLSSTEPTPQCVSAS
jgi:DNA-binding response OmpR family regulator